MQVITSDRDKLTKPIAIGHRQKVVPLFSERFLLSTQQNSQASHSKHSGQDGSLQKC